jgi:hypothetical protein
MSGFSAEFLREYSKAKYDAILAASEAACRNGYRAPDRNSTQGERGSVYTASAGSNANTAARVQSATVDATSDHTAQTETAISAAVPPSKQQQQSQRHTEPEPECQSQSQSQRQDSTMEDRARLIAVAGTG